MYQYDKTLSTEERIIKAKVQLQTEKPFFAYIMSQMEIARNDSTETISVNRYGNIQYNKNFVDKLSMSELKGVLSHEAMHVALEHLDRKEGRNHRAWNVATDIAINNLLVKDNFTLPECAFIPRKDSVKIEALNGAVIDDLSNKSADAVYVEMETIAIGLFGVDCLEDIFKQIDIGRFDEHIDEEREVGDIDEAIPDVIEKDWKDIMVEAWTHAEMKGNTPNGIKRVIDKIVKTEIPWSTLLNEYIMRELPIDYNWNYPSKRTIATGIYLPGIEKENIDVVVTIDTSASIDKKMLTAFMSEVIAIAQSSNHLKMTVLVGDAQIHQVIPVENGSIKKLRELELVGGGGTNHKPFYKWISENKPLCNIVINLTDGYTSYPTKDSVRTKSVWVMTEDVVPPFGKVIRMKKEGR